ncbi:UNVERIFIED_CONTAM: hypothetical protein HDU68_006900 [Siphonaria sp. JEL0065]|nr:hypothetical protein HDU68_006900 [Siphonaria sp. JEL0065]
MSPLTSVGARIAPINVIPKSPYVVDYATMVEQLQAGPAGMSQEEYKIWAENWYTQNSSEFVATINREPSHPSSVSPEPEYQFLQQTPYEERGRFEVRHIPPTTSQISQPQFSYNDESEPMTVSSTIRFGQIDNQVVIATTTLIRTTVAPTVALTTSGSIIVNPTNADTSLVIPGTSDQIQPSATSPTDTTATSAPKPTSSDSGSGASLGVVFGGIVGGFCFLVLIAIVLFFRNSYKTRKARQAERFQEFERVSHGPAPIAGSGRGASTVIGGGINSGGSVSGTVLRKEVDAPSFLISSRPGERPKSIGSSNQLETWSGGSSGNRYPPQQYASVQNGVRTPSPERD